MNRYWYDGTIGNCVLVAVGAAIPDLALLCTTFGMAVNNKVTPFDLVSLASTKIPIKGLSTFIGAAMGASGTLYGAVTSDDILPGDTYVHIELDRGSWATRTAWYLDMFDATFIFGKNFEFKSTKYVDYTC